MNAGSKVSDFSLVNIKAPRATGTMKELLRQYAAYNIWANQKMLDLILPLPVEKQDQEIPSSFSSLTKTVLHIWDAESIWWQRLKLQERINRPSEQQYDSLQDITSGLLAQSRQWQEWITNASDLSLEHVFQYHSLKNELFKQPVYQMLLHVFNHGTYHRGQLVNMLRQVEWRRYRRRILSFFQD